MLFVEGMIVKELKIARLPIPKSISFQISITNVFLSSTAQFNV